MYVNELTQDYGDEGRKAVTELLRRWDLERRDRAALRVERLHHLGDRPVLAGRVDALEDDQDRTLRFRPEPILEGPQSLHLAHGRRDRGRLVAAVRRAGIHPFETDARAWFESSSRRSSPCRFWA